MPSERTLRYSDAWQLTLPTPSETTMALRAASLVVLTFPTPSDLISSLSVLPPNVVLPTPSEEI